MCLEIGGAGHDEGRGVLRPGNPDDPERGFGSRCSKIYRVVPFRVLSIEARNPPSQQAYDSAKAARDCSDL
jgi:hypothetical protein